MEPSRGTRVTNWIVGATTPLVFTAGLALVGWISIWAIYAWAARDELWILTFGSVTLLALALPVAFVGCYERWQVRHGLYDAVPGTGTKTLNSACGLFAALLGLSAFAFFLLFAYLAWVFWSDGARAASVYFTIAALAMLAWPAAFLHYYDRWRTRNGVQ